MPKKLTQEEFIARAVAVHGSRYDYSETVYVLSSTKVSITCPEHGVFHQLPTDHAKGSQCWKCAMKVRDNGKITQQEFIDKARAVHGGRYDYSQAVYVNSKQNIKVICLKHGSFMQKAEQHLLGSGCTSCSRIQQALGLLSNTQEFIDKARAVHGDRYDYSNTLYRRSNRKVAIVCTEHGVFEQVPNSHLDGHGCRACAREIINAGSRLTWIEKGEGRLATLYLLRLSGSGEEFYKVGITYYSVSHRYRMGSLIPYEYEVIAQHKSTNAAAVYDWEQSILATFFHLLYRPKIRFGGETECFSSCEEILSIFPL